MLSMYYSAESKSSMKKTTTEEVGSDLTTEGVGSDQLIWLYNWRSGLRSSDLIVSIPYHFQMAHQPHSILIPKYIKGLEYLGVFKLRVIGRKIKTQGVPYPSPNWLWQLI